MIGDMGDGYQFVSFQYLANRLFSLGQFPFGWTDFWRYPYGIDFQNSYDSSLLIIFGLFLYRFLSNPILIYNISVFSFILLNLIFSYYSFSLLYPSIISLIGTIIYGLSFYSIAKLGGHINLFLISVFPLFFVSLYRIYLKKGSMKSFLFLSFSSILLAFSSLQYILILLGSLPFIFLITLVFFKEKVKKFIEILWKQKINLLTSLLSIIIIFSLFHGHKIISLFNKQIQFPSQPFSVPPINFIIPNSYLKTLVGLFPNKSNYSIEQVVFFGYVEITLFVISIYKLKKNKIFWYQLSLLIVFFIISLGNHFYGYLFRLFPYSGIFESNRFFVICYLVFTLIILHSLSKIKNQKIIAIIIVLLILERLPVNFYLSPSLYDKNFVEKLRSIASKTILNLPLFTNSGWHEQYYNMYSVYSGKPIVNGYIHWSGETNSSQAFIRNFQEYTCYYDLNLSIDYNKEIAEEKKNILLKLLIKYDIKIVVLHKDLSYYEVNCNQAQKYIDILFEDKNKWNKIFDDGEKEIFLLR
jgi:hypothetical protein